MARRKLVVQPQSGIDPVVRKVDGSRRLITINLDPNGTFRIGDPSELEGAIVRLRPCVGIDPDRYAGIQQSIEDFGAWSVVRLPIPRATIDSESESESDVEPEQARTESIEDAIERACDMVLDQDSVSGESERQLTRKIAMRVFRGG